MSDVPIHVHSARTVAAPVAEVVARLRADPSGRCAAATASAVTAVAPLLAEAGFRRDPAPDVAVELLARGPAVVRVAWNAGDVPRWPPASPFATRPTSRWWREEEEATGWPTLVLEVLATVTDGGTRLVAVTDRPPGYDLSTNRVDKHVRDRVARAAVDRFIAALAAELRDPAAPRATAREAPATGAPATGAPATGAPATGAPAAPAGEHGAGRTPGAPPAVVRS